MRIAKATLFNRWIWSTGLGIAAFAILTALDMRLKALTGVGTADLQGFSTAVQFQAAFLAWAAAPNAARAGFDLGFDYVLMPLYAASFFYSGIIVAENFAPRPGRLRRMILLAAMVPLAGALCDAVENALHFAMWLSGANEILARVAFTVSNAKTVALAIGLLLLLGAVIARVAEGKARKAP